MRLTEGDLKITLADGMVGRKFDDEPSHRLSHCMKAVDFIVEMDDRTVFVELKDPEHPSSPPKDRITYIKKFMSGAIDGDLKTKYRDSWLYEFAEGRAKKPIYYYVLIGAGSLTGAELLVRTEALKRILPVNGPNDGPWKKPFVAGCAVMNLEGWNRLLSNMPVSRVSA